MFLGGKQVEPILSIVIFWRRDTSHVKFEWIDSKWDLDKDLNQTTSEIDKTLGRLIKSSETLTYEAFVKVCIYFKCFLKYHFKLRLYIVIFPYSN